MPQTIRIGKLDFEDIKASLKNYLSQQTEFTDYNFEGSNISQLINLLAYNAHYDALAANFLANESFLDTATKRSSVVSRAKELGYVPRSRRASSTTLSLSFKNVQNENDISEMAIPKGTRFNTKVNDEYFTFTTIETVTIPKTIEGGNPIFRGNVVVYEGVLIKYTSTLNDSDPITSIPNEDIDTSTLMVEIFEDGQWVEYSTPSSFLSLNPTSRMYAIQEGFKGFEIYFGDGVLGKKPAPTSTMRLTYMVTSGIAANGAKSFDLVSSIAGVLSNTIVTVTALAPSNGGLDVESIESIRMNAKNVYSTQNRAVTANDYAALAAQKFPIIKDVLAWNGSDNVPPKFGKVILSVKPTVGEVLSQSDKASIASYLQSKGVGNIKVDFEDPKYVNITIRTKVKYSAEKIQVSTYDLQFLVKSVIFAYASTAINKFNGSFRYSSLVSAIDDANYAITSNETVLGLSKELQVSVYHANNFIFSFGNEISSLSSTQFFDGESSNKMFLSDSNGIINSYYLSNGRKVISKTNIGTVDYKTGEVSISNLYISGLDELKFKITAVPVNLDITSSKSNVLMVSQEDLIVTVERDDKI